MRHADFIDATENAAHNFAGLLEAAELTQPVPSCPGWTLVELTEHLGGVHRWARAQLLGGGAQVAEPADDQAADAAEAAEAPGGPVAPGAALGEREALLAWFREGASALVATLRDLPEDEPCWALYPPARASTWAKRQALETTLHLWDAADSLGVAAPISTRVAAAGVAEVAEDMYPRQVALNRMPSLDATVDLRLRDAGSGPGALVRFGPVGEAAEDSAGDGDGDADATLELSAEDALLLLWKRRGLTEMDARLTGSREALDRVLAHPLVP